MRNHLRSFARPIQFALHLLDRFRPVDQWSRSASRRSAYAVIRSIHCRNGMRTTGKWLPPLGFVPPLALPHWPARCPTPGTSSPVLRPDTRAGADPGIAAPLRSAPDCVRHRQVAIGNRQAPRSASAFFLNSGSYQVSKIWRKIHCVQLHVIRIGGVDFAVPVVAEAEHLDLAFETCQQYSSAC